MRLRAKRRSRGDDRLTVRALVLWSISGLPRLDCVLRQAQQGWADGQPTRQVVGYVDDVTVGLARLRRESQPAADLGSLW